MTLKRKTTNSVAVTTRRITMFPRFSYAPAHPRPLPRFSDIGKGPEEGLPQDFFRHSTVCGRRKDRTLELYFSPYLSKCQINV